MAKLIPVRYRDLKYPDPIEPQVREVPFEFAINKEKIEEESKK